MATTTQPDTPLFFKLLNTRFSYNSEQIAREANKEDNCKGRFWEGRFKSQALLDEAAVLSCMAYVDLNPVRAGIAKDLEASDFTSIQARIREIQTEKQSTKKHRETTGEPTPALLPFIESEHQQRNFAAIPFNLKDYLELVDWTGRCIREDKRGAIDANARTILETLGIEEQDWLTLAVEIQKRSISMLSGLERIQQRQRPLSKAA